MSQNEQVQTKIKELAEANMKRMEELVDGYIQLFLDELEFRNKECPQYYLYVPQTIIVELVEDKKEQLLRGSRFTYQFNFQALLIAKDRLDKMEGIKAKIKYINFFEKDPSLAFARRLVCKVRIDKLKEKN